MPSDPRFDVTTEEALAGLFDAPAPASLVKELDHVDANYRALIEASPFTVLATSGPGGLDCSPRGDKPGFVVVEDERTLLMPDRRGNNRIDSLRNIVRDPRVGLLFLIPGAGETLRINGRARISAAPDLIARFVVDGRPPKLVLVIAVETVFFQCSRAVLRADLWNPAARVDRASLPSAGKILSDITDRQFDGEAYDRDWPARARNALY